MCPSSEEVEEKHYHKGNINKTWCSKPDIGACNISITSANMALILLSFERETGVKVALCLFGYNIRGRRLTINCVLWHWLRLWLYCSQFAVIFDHNHHIWSDLLLILLGGPLHPLLFHVHIVGVNVSLSLCNGMRSKNSCTKWLSTSSFYEYADSEDERRIYQVQLRTEQKEIGRWCESEGERRGGGREVARRWERLLAV